MSLRLTEERQRRILGITDSGKIIPFIMGSEPGDDDSNDEENQDGSGEGGSGSGGEGEGGTGTEGTGVKKIWTDEEVASIINRMKAADKKASDYEKKINDAELATKSEIEQSQIREKQARAEADAAREELKKARIHNKFLAANKVTWHDPETALQLLDLSEVEVGDDGVVKGLEPAIKALSDSKPFLVKASEGDEGGKGNKNKEGSGGSTGNQPSGNKTGGTRDKDRARLLEKYPQLVQGR